jgi:hypothetical protein
MMIRKAKKDFKSINITSSTGSSRIYANSKKDFVGSAASIKS